MVKKIASSNKLWTNQIEYYNSKEGFRQNVIITFKKSLKIPMWKSETVNWSWTDNTTAKENEIKDKQKSTKHYTEN